VRPSAAKRLIKWLYFRYVYPDEVAKICEILSNGSVVYQKDGPTRRAMIEREWIPNNELH